MPPPGAPRFRALGLGDPWGDLSLGLPRLRRLFPPEPHPYGKALYALGANRAAARLSGIPVEGYVVLTYALAGMFNALGGVILLGHVQLIHLTLGEAYTLPSVIAVVAGGTSLSGEWEGTVGRWRGAAHHAPPKCPSHPEGRGIRTTGCLWAHPLGPSCLLWARPAFEAVRRWLYA